MSKQDTVVIQHPDETLLISVQTLWQQAFGDGEAYLSLHFTVRYRAKDMLVAVEDGRVVSMLTMLPCRYKGAAGDLSACYVYAVATAEDRRGQGLAGMLLERAERVQRERGVELLVVAPAHFSLFFYYAARGYTDFFYVAEHVYLPEQLSAATGTAAPLTAKTLFRLREQTLTDFISWDEPAVAFALRAASMNGGGLHLKQGNREGAALYSCMGDEVYITELVTKGLSEQDAMALIHRTLQARRYTVRRDAYGEQDPIPFAQVRVLSGPPIVSLEPAYLGLPLD